MTEAPTSSSPQEHTEKTAKSSMQQPQSSKLPIIGLLVIIALGLAILKPWNTQKRPLFTSPFTQTSPLTSQDNFSVKKFNSAEDFQDYIQESQSSQGGFGMGMSAVAPTAMVAQDMAVTRDVKSGVVNPTVAESYSANQASAQRVSETNVQVKGIDEPDIVKTDGKNLFVSTDQWRFYNPRPMPVDLMIEERSTAPAVDGMSTAPSTIDSKILPYPGPDYQVATTKVLSAFPPAQMAKIADIDITGEMLLYKNTLIILGTKNGQNTISALDVAQPNQPKKTWTLKINEGNQVTTARLKDDSLYLITQTYSTSACPIMPLYQADGTQLTIPCTDISYPDRQVSNVDTIYTAMKVEPETGKVAKTSSIVGSSGQSIVYMSPNAIYLTYQTQPDMVKMLDSFITEQGKDLIPQSVADRLAKLRSYELSQSAKMVELQSILDSYTRSLQKDEKLKFENEMQNRMKTYLQSNSRELEQTMIVKLDADDLQADATGQVPGYPLNQFSLDEFDGNLRIATTFGQAWTQFGRPESASDVYVLDSALRQKGVVQDLGKGERIYAVRFLQDKGYVVTFKQVDPFYVLDLSNPSSPQKMGELKIPGYSSYLHALGKDKVLGIGKEDNQVKLSLFDVSNPADPREVSKYTLDEYWTEVENNHHAFLLDDKNKVFFIPGSKGAYIFSYKNDQLSLASAISQTQVKRAVFVDDYMFIVGQNEIKVLDEKDWKVVKELGI